MSIGTITVTKNVLNSILNQLLFERDEMSAYVVEREHIVYLVKVAVQKNVKYYQNGDWVKITKENQADIGQILWNENIRSVSGRYPGSGIDDLPGRIGESYELNQGNFRGCLMHTDPAQVLMSIRCYDYQTCESDDFETTEAWRIKEAIKSEMIRIISDDKEWGYPKEAINTNAVSIFDL